MQLLCSHCALGPSENIGAFLGIMFPAGSTWLAQLYATPKGDLQDHDVIWSLAFFIFQVFITETSLQYITELCVAQKMP